MGGVFCKIIEGLYLKGSEEDMYKLRNYQISCANLLISEVNSGNKRLLVEMVTGAGRLRTVFHTINHLHGCKGVIYLTDREALKSLFMLKGSSELNNNLQVESHNVRELSKATNFNEFIVNGDNLLILDVEKIDGKLKSLLDSFEGIIFILTNNADTGLVNQFGKPVFSLKSADTVDKKLRSIHSHEISLNIDSTSQNTKYIEIIKNEIEKYDILTKVGLCQTFCDTHNKRTILKSEDLIIEIIPFIVGLIISGPLVAMISKLSVISITNVIKDKIPKVINCYECLNEGTS